MNPLDQQKKLILDSTSTVSQNDRFTSLLKHQQAGLMMDIPATVNQQTAASLEMVNRPSVLAALKNTSVRHLLLDKIQAVDDI